MSNALRALIAMPDEVLRCIVASLWQDRDLSALICSCTQMHERIADELDGLWEERLAQRYRDTDPDAYDVAVMPTMQWGSSDDIAMQQYRKLCRSNVDAKMLLYREWKSLAIYDRPANWLAECHFPECIVRCFSNNGDWRLVLCILRFAQIVADHGTWRPPLTKTTYRFKIAHYVLCVFYPQLVALLLEQMHCMYDDAYNPVNSHLNDVKRDSETMIRYYTNHPTQYYSIERNLSLDLNQCVTDNAIGVLYSTAVRLAKFQPSSKTEGRVYLFNSLFAEPSRDANNLASVLVTIGFNVLPRQ